MEEPRFEKAKDFVEVRMITKTKGSNNMAGANGKHCKG